MPLMYGDPMPWQSNLMNGNPVQSAQQWQAMGNYGPGGGGDPGFSGGMGADPNNPSWSPPVDGGGPMDPGGGYPEDPNDPGFRGPPAPKYDYGPGEGDAPRFVGPPAPGQGGQGGEGGQGGA